VKRATIVTGAAMLGVAWIVSYRVTPHASGVALLPPTQTPPASPATPPPPSPGPTPSPSSSPSPVPSPSPTPSATGVSGSFTGADVPNRFGDVQVRVVVSGGRITDVQAVQMPFDRQQSAYISQVAGPMLRSEVLQAQSAQIDIISGATYTSESYAQSVESALQKAHLA
jgi:uncharacterized protein with FMN-binding domain